jgi:membrane protein YqaA with SNARE-associated domain
MESLAIWFQESLLPYGAWGILVLAAMDSSFVPMPAFIDLAVMGAAALAPENALFYGAAAVVGSTAGVLVVYGLARSGRQLARDEGKRTAWAEGFLERRGALALLVAALMPAPFPFKVVVLASGYLRQPVISVVLGVGGGRLIRFGAEAFLAARYGDEIVAAVQSNAPLVGLGVAVVIVLVAVVAYRWRPTTSDATPSAEAADES